MTVCALHDYILQIEDKLLNVVLICLLEIRILKFPSVLIRVHRLVPNKVIVAILHQMHPFKLKVSCSSLHRVFVGLAILFKFSSTSTIVLIWIVQIAP